MSRRRAIVMVLATMTIVWGSLVWLLASGNSPKLGLDLQGGFSVILEAPEGTDSEVLDKAVEIMRRRIEALGNVQEPEIAVAGERNVVVQLPGVEDRDRALEAVGTTGQLEFRQVLDVGPAQGVSPLLLNVQQVVDDSTTTTTVPWFQETTTTVPEFEVVLPQGIEWCDSERPLNEQPGCVDETSGITQVDDPSKEAWLVNAENGFVYHLAASDLTGADLARADAQFLSNSGGGNAGGLVNLPSAGSWSVLVDFSSEGAQKFEDFTRELGLHPPGNPRRSMAIVLDGEIVSDPPLAAGIDVITGGSAVINVGTENQEQEAKDLSVVLRYGALPVAFELPSVQSVSATLGTDSLNAGLVAGIGGLALVALAMIFYYRALGVVNVIGLSIFGSLVIGVFALLGATQGVTLTLAGVAGVIVSVGITSDSYIVYFERIKEEVHKGRGIRSAADHAFKRSFRTILTADSVSFAGAVLLYLLAIGSVRGFALALGIATVADVVVAYYYTRPAVALLARSKLGDGGKLSIRGATGEAAEVPA